jgi:hypothetical protein
MNIAPKVGLFSKIFGGNLSFGSILSGTQKTLNIVNQAIPIVKQAGPVINNTKTMFKVMNEFKKVETPKSEKKVTKIENDKTNENNIQNENSPTFFA